jgi:hypothetical protein
MTSTASPDTSTWVIASPVTLVGAAMLGRLCAQLVGHDLADDTTGSYANEVFTMHAAGPGCGPQDPPNLSTDSVEVIWERRVGRNTCQSEELPWDLTVAALAEALASLPVDLPHTWDDLYVYGYQGGQAEIAAIAAELLRVAHAMRAAGFLVVSR